MLCLCGTSFKASTCLHTSAYVSIRQHTSAYVSTRQHTSAHVSTRQHTSAHVSIRQHTSAHVSIRRLASAPPRGPAAAAGASAALSGTSPHAAPPPREIERERERKRERKKERELYIERERARAERERASASARASETEREPATAARRREARRGCRSCSTDTASLVNICTLVLVKLVNCVPVPQIHEEVEHARARALRHRGFVSAAGRGLVSAAGTVVCACCTQCRAEALGLFSRHAHSHTCVEASASSCATLPSLHGGMCARTRISPASTAGLGQVLEAQRVR
jgi:hypothetical protein